MAAAAAFAQRSSCTRKKVGCVVADWDLTSIVSIGYNGNARGLSNGCERPDEPGNCGCLHAEDNALIKAPYGQPLIMFTTLVPCKTCAKRIINSSVAMVVYSDGDYRADGLDLLKTAGVYHFHFKEN